MSMLISQVDIDLFGVLVLGRKPMKLVLLLSKAMVQSFAIKTGMQAVQDES